MHENPPPASKLRDLLERADTALTRGEVDLWPPPRFAELLAAEAERWNGAALAVEAANHGFTVLDRLESGLRRGTLFHHDLASGSKRGWHTNAQTRPVLVDEAVAALRGGHARARDEGLIGECSTLVLGSGGKIEAARGAHDDRFMAFGIAWQATQRPTWLDPGVFDRPLPGWMDTGPERGWRRW